jgi:tRNA nucleotidyltransferase (CCA-adding enzyme)
MPENMKKVMASVLDKITPDNEKRVKIETLAKKLEKKVVSACKELGVKAKVRVEGSVAKDTWLSEEPDIDVFMRVPTSIPRKSLGDVCLNVARKATEGFKQIERFAEHPYLEAIVDNVRVNIVPCYEVKRGQWLSATDRTPFHTDYMKKRLTQKMLGEVRLLKKFMKGIDVYGAEIKVGGFSGYLCELLTFHYKSFLDTLLAFSQYRRRIVVDIENYYKNRENELDLLFNELLVVVDPVDKARNVASAVQTRKLYAFVAATRAFVKKPSPKFFYPPKTEALSIKELEKKLRKRGSDTVFLTFGMVDAVPDVLWGQLYKSQRSLRKLLQLNDFSLLRDVAWSDEKALNMFVFELEQRLLPLAKKHFGPPLEKQEEGEKFLLKHVNSSDAVSGPYVEGGRWVVMVHRKHTDVVALLNERLKDGGRNAGVAEQVSLELQKGFKVLVNDEIVKVYEKNDEFANFLTGFLSGKPKWLETS